MPDLWPEEFNELGVTPPLSILKEQAQSLGLKTKQRVVGRVLDVIDNISFPRYDFVYSFELVAPVLDDYSYTLFRASHDLDLYPVQIKVDGTPAKEIKCDNQDGLLDVLREIFSSEQTRKVMGSLLAQTNAAMSKK